MNTSVIMAGCLLVMVILFWLVMSYRGFAKLQSSSQEAFATAEVFLKKRQAMAQNLAKTGKDYVPKQAEILENLGDAIELAENAISNEEKINNEKVLSETLLTLFASAEDYPGLGKNRSFVSMRAQIKKVEKDIVQAGSFYNVIVKMMNTRVRALPSNLIAKLFGFKKQPMFEFLTSVVEDSGNDSYS